MSDFYARDQAVIHHEGFGDVARGATSRLLTVLRGAGLTEGSVVDLGSGSGILARIVSEAGYDVRGIDISPDMVALASQHAPRASFVCGSALDAEIPHGTVGVTAVGEVLNYAADERAGPGALAELARRIRAALHPDGVFLLDLATPGRAGPGGRREAFHDHDAWSMHVSVWEEADAPLLHRRMRIFTRTDDGRYRRDDEHHRLRLYDVEEVVGLLDEAGFRVAVADSYPSPAASSIPGGGWKVFEARPA